ncbi:MAG: flagellin, partial [Synergistaceae bacterium]|nr:flagellin [Synergistaceae bacterium]
MRINTNVMSYVAYNATVKSSSQLAKASEKLATGLRINSAADDAAGLAISEKMTAQIRGLDQATRNAQDGMSLLQTAEGALNEIHSMLQRMRELAIQAANDVLTAEDRDYIQLEVNELTRQITDIANQTQFNKKKLLNGDSAILWSTSTSDIRVLVGGTLLKKDIFGQTVNAEGNYKITFETIQAGNEQVQKSNIFYLKHGTTDTNAAIDGSSGVTGFDA